MSILIHFLQAYQAGAYYPQYQFVLVGWYGTQWWVGSEATQEYLFSQYDCTVANRVTALAYSISVLQDEFASNFSKVVDSGIVSYMLLHIIAIARNVHNTTSATT